MSSVELRSKAENTSPDGTEWIYSQDSGSPYTVKKIDLDTIVSYISSQGLIPAGTIIESAAISAPTGYLAADGTAKARSTYSALYGAITEDKGEFTVTIASPGVISLSTHGLSTGHCVELTTTGALPTGLSENTNYYVIYNDADSFWLATSLANAIAGTKIDTSGTQSGTHNLRFAPFGISGADNFLLPNRAALVGKATGSQAVNGRTKTGPVLGAVEEDQMQQITGEVSTDLLTRSWADIVQKLEIGALSLAETSSVTRYPSLAGSALNIAKIMFDSSNSTDARAGTTTRENSIGMNYYIKY